MYYTFEKWNYVFDLITRFVCLSATTVTMAGLINKLSSEAITLDNSSRLQHYKGDPVPDPDYMIIGTKSHFSP